MTTLSDAQIKAWMAKQPLAFRATPAVRARRIGLWVLFVGLFAWCLYDFNFAPERIWVGLQRLGTVVSFMFPPHLWETWPEWVEVFQALGETVAMAFLGTILGLIIAFPISFLGAKNITRIFWVRHTARRGYDIIRAFETLILALIFIRAFGLGPLAGILAIAVSEIGTFGKLFSEALENTSKRPVEGVVASGGSRFQAILYGIMPQVLPVHLSIILYNFESNVRSSTILGIVGAGGIGFMLSDRIAGLFWDQVWTIIFLIIAMVYVVDYLSGLIRTRVIGKWEGAH